MVPLYGEHPCKCHYLAIDAIFPTQMVIMTHTGGEAVTKQERHCRKTSVTSAFGIPRHRETEDALQKHCQQLQK